MIARPLRIFVAAASEYLTDATGHGEGLICNAILQRLAERGHEIIVCTRRASFRANPPFRVIEIAPCRFESLQSIVYALRVRLLYQRLTRRAHFDVVYWMMPQGRGSILWPWPGQTPTVIGPLSLEWHASRTPKRLGDGVRVLATRTVAGVYRRTMQRASVVLASSGTAAAELGHHLPIEKLIVVPFGVDVDGLSPVPPPPAGGITMVGRLVGEKGVFDLLEAFAIVSRRFTEVRLTFVGDGPERVRLADLASRLGLAERVEFCGSVSHDEVIDHLTSARIFCLPSWGEPFGMAILEAMACGRPVVSTSAGFPAELLSGDVGVLVQPHDAHGLAHALSNLLGDYELCVELGTRARARIEASFTWARAVSRIEEILRFASSSASMDDGDMTALRASGRLQE